MIHNRTKLIFNIWISSSAIVAIVLAVIYFTSKNIENDEGHNYLALATVYVGISYLLMRLLTKATGKKPNDESNL